MPTTEHPRGVPTFVLALAVPLVALIAITVTLSVTSNDTVRAGGRGDASSEATSVTIQNFAFSPPTLRVAAGSTVAVTNADGAAHTLTARDGTFDTGSLDGGADARITISAPGSYEYFCAIHNYMTGRIEAR